MSAPSACLILTTAILVALHVVCDSKVATLFFTLAGIATGYYFAYWEATSKDDPK